MCEMRARLPAMRQEKTIYLGLSCKKRAILFVRTGPLGQQGRHHRSQRQSVPSAFHPERRGPVQMAPQTDHERTENNVHEYGELGLSR